MPLVRLLYASKFNFAADDMAPVRDILGAARAFNSKNDVTGLLACRNGEFLQAIEGARATILSLFRFIGGDKRHKDVTLLHFSEVSARSFYKWDMGLIREGDIPKSINMYFGGTHDFSFDSIRSDHAMSYLLYCAQRDLVCPGVAA